MIIHSQASQIPAKAAFADKRRILRTRRERDQALSGQPAQVLREPRLQAVEYYAEVARRQEVCTFDCL